MLGLVLRLGSGFRLGFSVSVKVRVRVGPDATVSLLEVHSKRRSRRIWSHTRM